LLKDRFGARSIFASGLPPLQHFPLLPEPLRSVLGRRAAQFDEVLRDVLHARDRTYYVPMEFPLDPALMASDGFHPGPKVYDEWALRVARLVLGDVEK
ncbi:MAG: SGNH/GDSL hydrolase family protein, partial [Pseudomonadota bacterium]